MRPLSDREIEVVAVLATGASNLRIARKLGVSINTIKTHLQNISAVLGTHNRTETALRARHILARSQINHPIG